MLKTLAIFVVLLAVCCLVAGEARAQTTGFTFQGSLRDGVNPATGTYDMQFTLFDATGTQQGATITNSTVAVANGIFTVQLDFGSGPFAAGAERFLEIGVRLAGNPGAYTVLEPRQRFTSAPYAIRAAGAANADLLGGQPPSAFATTAQNAALQAQIAQLQAELAATTGGTQLWSRRMGGSSNDIGRSVALDASGDVFITGFFRSTVDFGGGNLISAGGEDIFVAKYSGATGAHLWSKRFGSTGFDYGRGIAVDGSGNVFVTGQFTGTVDFGSGVPLISAGIDEVFLVKLSGADGSTTWAKRFGGTSSDVGHGVAAAPNGDAIITGFFFGSADFGGLVLTSAGNRDIFVARYTGATGSHVWSKRFGGMSGEEGNGIATDASGNVFATGYYNSTSIDFGGGALTNAGAVEGYLVKLTAADGTHLWSKRFGGTFDDSSTGTAVDSNGSVFVTGYFGSPVIDFGGGGRTNAGAHDVFVAKYDSSGMHEWSKSLGGTGDDVAFGITLDGGGDPVITGYFFGTTNLGGPSLNTAGSADIFAAKYSGANGAQIWSRRFGGTSLDLGWAIAANTSGDIFMTGYFGSPSIDFGGGPLTSAGGDDIFLAKLKK